MENIYKNIRILVVDDEPDILEIIQEIFMSEFNCQVDTAANGLEAIDLLEMQKYDLVCTDLHMPMMDGTGLVKGIREGSTKNKAVYIFIISGYPSDSDKIIASYDNVLILDKPINEKRLLSSSKLFLKL